MGTLNEFTIAFEDRKPVGVLEKTGGAADTIKDIVDKSHRGPGNVVYSTDPKVLVDKLLALIDQEKSS